VLHVGSDGRLIARIAMKRMYRRLDRESLHKR
jgi:hypothetical protein